MNNFHRFFKHYKHDPRKGVNDHTYVLVSDEKLMEYQQLYWDKEFFSHELGYKHTRERDEFFEFVNPVNGDNELVQRFTEIFDPTLIKILESLRILVYEKKIVPEFSHHMWDELTEWERMVIIENIDTLICPDCLNVLLPGPRGGSAQNFYCSSQYCGSKFNFAFFRKDHLFLRQRISERSPLAPP